MRKPFAGSNLYFLFFSPPSLFWLRDQPCLPYPPWGHGVPTCTSGTPPELLSPRLPPLPARRQPVPSSPRQWLGLAGGTVRSWPLFVASGTVFPRLGSGGTQQEPRDGQLRWHSAGTKSPPRCGDPRHPVGCSECGEVWGGLGVPVCSPGLEMALGACWRVSRVGGGGIPLAWQHGHWEPCGHGCHGGDIMGTMLGGLGLGAELTGSGDHPQGAGVPVPSLAVPPSPPAPGSPTAALDVVTSPRSLLLGDTRDVPPFPLEEQGAEPRGTHVQDQCQDLGAGVVALTRCLQTRL